MTTFGGRERVLRMQHSQTQTNEGHLWAGGHLWGVKWTSPHELTTGMMLNKHFLSLETSKLNYFSYFVEVFRLGQFIVFL